MSTPQSRRALCADAPIDLDEQIGVALLGYLRNIRHAFFTSFDVRLPRKAREYAHDQDHIDLFDERIERLDGHIGLERERRMSSPLANMLQEGMKLVFVGHGLDMDRDIIRVKIEIPIDLLLRIRDHEVHIDGEIGYGAELLDERYADCKVGYEMPIHHIDMNDIGSRFFEHADIALHIHEVR